MQTVPTFPHPRDTYYSWFRSTMPCQHPFRWLALLPMQAWHGSRSPHSTVMKQPKHKLSTQVSPHCLEGGPQSEQIHNPFQHLPLHVLSPQLWERKQKIPTKHDFQQINIYAQVSNINTDLQSPGIHFNFSPNIYSFHWNLFINQWRLSPDRGAWRELWLSRENEQMQKCVKISSL